MEDGLGRRSIIEVVRAEEMWAPSEAFLGLGKGMGRWDNSESYR